MSDEASSSSGSWWNLGTSVTSNLGSVSGSIWSKAKETVSLHFLSDYINPFLETKFDVDENVRQIIVW